MKINYNLKENYFKNYNDANGVMSKLKALQKNPNTKVRSYLCQAFIYCAYLFIFSFALLIISIYLKKNFLLEVSSFLLSSSILLFLFYYMWLYACSRLEINSKEGTLVIGKNGLVDENKNGNKLTIAYKNIKAVVITNNLIVFALNTPLMLFIPNKNTKAIVEELEKNSNVLIIDKSKQTNKKAKKVTEK